MNCIRPLKLYWIEIEKRAYTFHGNILSGAFAKGFYMRRKKKKVFSKQYFFQTRTSCSIRILKNIKSALGEILPEMESIIGL